jgi:hypothetical protein
MSQQGTLFDSPKRLRRNTDPATSHRSAEWAWARGLVSTQREEVLELIRQHPGRDCSGLVTAALHHGMLYLDRSAVSKRLSELHAAGKIKHPPTESRARVWFVV